MAWACCDGAVAWSMDGLGLLDLLVQLGSFDLGQHLPFLDAVADIDVALADVAAGARQHRRLR